jgi:hypothetical protein
MLKDIDTCEVHFERDLAGNLSIDSFVVLRNLVEKHVLQEFKPIKMELMEQRL